MIINTLYYISVRVCSGLFGVVPFVRVFESKKCVLEKIKKKFLKNQHFQAGLFAAHPPSELAALLKSIFMNMKLMATLLLLVVVGCVGLWLQGPVGCFIAGFCWALLLTNTIGYLVVRRHHARQQRWLRAGLAAKL
jgi:hypothetical protein